MAASCRHRDVFGKPGAGAHSVRFLGVAVVDVLATAVAAWAAAWAFGWSFGWTMLALVVLGAVVHRAFCVNTALNVVLFGRV